MAHRQLGVQRGLILGSDPEVRPDRDERVKPRRRGPQPALAEHRAVRCSHRIDRRCHDAAAVSWLGATAPQHRTSPAMHHLAEERAGDRRRDLVVDRRWLGLGEHFPEEATDGRVAERREEAVTARARRRVQERAAVRMRELVHGERVVVVDPLVRDVVPHRIRRGVGPLLPRDPGADVGQQEQGRDSSAGTT